MSRKIYTKIKNNLNGGEIKAIRLALGLSQTQFGDRLGITHNYLSELENNKKKPSDILTNLINQNKTEFKTKPSVSNDSEFKQAIGDLKEIFDSENDVLIKAIQANLCAFKHAAKAEKEKLDMQNRMEKTIKRLEVENKELKGCAGGSPPFSLNPGNCGPTGTEDPET
jgi:transcriptional regulator with XRE-family HTH domain